MNKLHIHIRKTDENVEKLRSDGKVPAVFYGPKETSTSVTLDAHEFKQVWEAVGSSAIVDLVGVGEEKEVLIHEVAWHPVTGQPIHVDFYCIERGKKVTVTVPIVFINEAPAEKLGGIVTKALHEIEIEVRPRDIPQQIEVDLNNLDELTSVITIGDLHLGDEIKIFSEAEEAIVSITLPQEEVEDERTIDDVEIEGDLNAEEESDETSDAKEVKE